MYSSLCVCAREAAMDATSPSKPIALDFFPYFRVNQDGSVERLIGEELTPAGVDPDTGVSSKDITISSAGISARLYLPKLTASASKLPVVVYFHGGAFCIGRSSSAIVHTFINTIVAEARVLLISVDYRLVPEHFLPVAYDDSWAALEWVDSNLGGVDPEPWLVEHADFDQVFLAGDSAGGNITHNMALRAGKSELPHGLKLAGIVLLHPYFWGSERLPSETAQPEMTAFIDRLWSFICPTSSGNDDPLINPVAPGAPSLAGLACERVLVCVAGKDILKDRDLVYYEALSKSGWKGEAEMYETKDAVHEFYVLDPAGEKTLLLIKKFASFFGGGHGSCA